MHGSLALFSHFSFLRTVRACIYSGFGGVYKNLVLVFKKIESTSTDQLESIREIGLASRNQLESIREIELVPTDRAGSGSGSGMTARIFPEAICGNRLAQNCAGAGSGRTGVGIAGAGRADGAVLAGGAGTRGPAFAGVLFFRKRRRSLSVERMRVLPLSSTSG